LQFFYNSLWVDHQVHVSPLSGYAIWRYPVGYAFPGPFGLPAFASCALLCPLRDWPALTIGWTGLLQTATGVTAFRIGKKRWASWPLYAGSGAPPQLVR